MKSRNEPVIGMLSCLLGLEDSHTLFYVNAVRSIGYPVLLISPGSIPDHLQNEQITFSELPFPTHHFDYDSSIFNILSGLGQRFRNSTLAYRSLIANRPDIVFCSQPDSWWIAIQAKRRLHNIVVADLREIYEDRASAFGKLLQPLIRRIIRLVFQRLSRNTDEIIHVSKARQEHYRYLDKKGIVISIFPPTASKPKHDSRSSNQIKIVHAGGLRWSYGSEELLLAIPLVLEQEPNACFYIIGDSRSDLQNTALKNKLEQQGSLITLPNIPHEEVLKHLFSSDIGLSLVLPIDQTHILAMPRKLFEYLSAGIPVVGSDTPTIREVLEDNNCGVLVDARSPQSIADGILILCKNPILRKKMGNNGKNAAMKLYNAESEIGKIRNLIHRFEQDVEGNIVYE